MSLLAADRIISYTLVVEQVTKIMPMYRIIHFPANSTDVHYNFSLAYTVSLQSKQVRRFDQRWHHKQALVDCYLYDNITTRRYGSKTCFRYKVKLLGEFYYKVVLP